MRAGRRHMGNATSRRIAAIRKDELAGPNRKPGERLARAGSRGLGHAKMVAGQGGKTHAVVDPPQRSSPARLFHRRRVERPNLKRPIGRKRDALLAEQRHAQRVKPVLRLAQPFQQSNVG